jgi:hypothetical protein
MAYDDRGVDEIHVTAIPRIITGDENLAKNVRKNTQMVLCKKDRASAFRTFFPPPPS